MHLPKLVFSGKKVLDVDSCALIAASFDYNWLLEKDGTFYLISPDIEGNFGFEIYDNEEAAEFYSSAPKKVAEPDIFGDYFEFI